jgi:catechol 2,3-dioxygenase
MQAARFAPRRLGHINLFVSDLEQSIDFWWKSAGIELIRREPAIRAGFHGNGNTHHDVGMIQAAQGVVRGRDGTEQPSSRRGERPGLNHLGWEMTSEGQLVEALRRATGAGVKLSHTVNHQISHSAYLSDPDGNYHEFYADIIPDWRNIFNLEHEDLVTQQWDWRRTTQPVGSCYPVDPPIRRVADAPLHPLRITHVRLVARDYASMFEFMVSVAGLRIVAEAEGVALLECSVQGLAMVLLSSRWDLQPGLHSASFELADADSVPAGALRSEGKESVILNGPDHLLVEFYRRLRAPRLPVPDARNSNWMFAE